MRIATWNVNSLKVRLPHVLDWLESSQADVLCLQETKQQDCDFPQNELQQIGYQVAFCGQKTYNGVAILSKFALHDVQFGIPGFSDEQKRVVSATIDGVRVICVYIPNGQSLDSDKFQYKLAWLAALRDWLQQELEKFPKLVLLGDFNIAPDDRDVYDPQAWEGKILVSPAERAALQNIEQLGLRDSFRLFEQPEKSYSWWDYRMMGFRRNMGLRIDHIYISTALECSECSIDKAPRKLERPSDHTPVVATIS